MLPFILGLPTRNGHRHAPEIAALASDILNMMKQKKFPESIKHKIQLRIGINTGKPDLSEHETDRLFHYKSMRGVSRYCFLFYFVFQVLTDI